MHLLVATADPAVLGLGVIRASPAPAQENRDAANQAWQRSVIRKPLQLGAGWLAVR